MQNTSKIKIILVNLPDQSQHEIDNYVAVKIFDFWKRVHISDSNWDDDGWTVMMKISLFLVQLAQRPQCQPLINKILESTSIKYIICDLIVSR